MSEFGASAKERSVFHSFAVYKALGDTTRCPSQTDSDDVLSDAQQKKLFGPNVAVNFQAHVE